MQFTALLSVLALVASTTTASPIAARQLQDLGQGIQFISPWNEIWPQGTDQTVSWALPLNTSDILKSQAIPAYGQLFLGNGIDDTGSENISRKLLPNLLCFTVVVTQQYFSFACTCNPLYRRAACS
jgi:hypothetical protein